jgi:hypothetical protein
MSAARSIDQDIADINLAVTPNGELIVPRESYERLSREQKLYIGEALSWLNNNKNSFAIKGDKLRVTSPGLLPDKFESLVIAWFDKKIDNRVSELEKVIGNATSLTYTPSSFYWYDNYYDHSTHSHTVHKDMIHRLDMPEHANLPSNKIGCEKGHTEELTGRVEISYNLDLGDVKAKTTLDYSYKNFMNCNTSAQRDVSRGETGYMYWTYINYKETQYWERWYLEDWNDDGIADYTAYRGQELAYVYAYSSGNFDYDSVPNPCQKPCSGLNCPFK